MTFKVTILGSGSALPMAGKHHSAHALNVHEQFYLVDCGEGSQSRMVEYGINPLRLNAVFITHLHGDHVYGLFPLLSTMGLMGRGTPLHIFAPAPLGELLRSVEQYLGEEPPFEVIYHEVSVHKHQVIYENKVMQVLSVPLRHRVPTIGYLFREKEPQLNVRKDMIEFYGLGIADIVAAKRGEDVVLADGRTVENSRITYRPYAPRSYAYLSDTLYSAKAASLVSGVDMLYHEATFADADRALAKTTGHSTAKQAATVALKADAGKLLIGHFSGRYKDVSPLIAEARAVFPETYAAEEGKTFEIAVKKMHM
jgi:ribonuclease Z